MIKKYLPRILPHITISLVLVMVTLVILYQFNQWIVNGNFFWIMEIILCILSFATSVCMIAFNRKGKKSR